jgi:GT2 family glycosyltransferase
MSGPAGTGRPALSVIVPTRDRRELLLAKLRSLSHQSLDASAFEVVVCDDGSSDGTHEALAALSLPFRLELVRTEGGRGPAAARNLAARGARGGILLMSDDDCILTPDSLQAHLDAHGDHPGSVVIGPLRLPEELRDGATREPFERVTSVAGRAGWINATGANTSIPAVLFQEVGCYDETITGYGGEDPDLALRLRAHGARFRFEPRALAIHHGRQLGEESLGKAFSAGQASWRLYRRYSEAIVGLQLGVHPLLLALKRPLFSDRFVAFTGGERFRYEREYLRGALEARRKESANDR